jgi:signal peptidase
MIARRIGQLLIVATVVAWFVLLRPTALGGPASYIFVSGVSMQPTLETGDLVVLQASEGYAIGDVVAFRVPDENPGAGSLVIHRIIGGSADDGFVTQGDNKPAPDEWRPTDDLVVGRLWVHLPAAGAVVAWLAAGLVVFLIVLGGRSARPPRTEIPADG